MRSLTRFAIILSFLAHLCEGVPRAPFLKSSLNFTIACATNRTLDSFDGHGCWCKEKGQLGEPVDDIDNCCKYHETSVEKLLKSPHCNLFNSFVLPYSVFCAKTKDGKKPTCLRDSGNTCARYLCTFDVWLASCLQYYINELPPGYKAACPQRPKSEW